MVTETRIEMQSQIQCLSRKWGWAEHPLFKEIVIHSYYQWFTVDSYCVSYFDGLVCWPGTAPGNSAVVDCFHIDAFAQALTGITENQEIGKEL